MFKSNVAPVKMRGQWYDLKVSSTGKSYKLEHDPLGCVLMKTGVIKLPPNFIILDIMADVQSIKSSDKSVETKYFDEAVQGFTIPDKSSFKTATFWVFAYKDGI